MSELDVATLHRDSVDAPGFTMPAPLTLQIDPRLAPTSAPETPKRLPTTWLLAACIAAASGAFGTVAFQMIRVMGDQERVPRLPAAAFVLVLFAATSVVVWTWMIVENARRLLAAGRTTEAPVPMAVAASWAMPIGVVAAGIFVVAVLERRLNVADAETRSAIPMAVALAFMVATLLLSYRPLFMLSSIMRRLGSSASVLARWVWVPILLAIAGVATLVALRVGGGFGDDFDGIAPAWALGLIFLQPAVILLPLAWRGGRAVEDSVQYAFDRRTGRVTTGVGRRPSLFSRLLGADARPSIELDTRRHVRIVPGANIVRLALMTTVAALTLVSIVGALVMFLFWQESSDGTLLASQRDRAWSALGGLQTLERMLAAGLVGIAMIWSLISVLGARISSGRRRNPLIASAAWPAAAYAIWWLGSRLVESETATDALTYYALQIAVLYVPFLLLERAATAVGARRGPLRLTFGIAAVLLVHVQGLGGLPTIVEITDVDRFGRLAGYLALAALLELIGMITITEASRLISDASTAMAEKHNFLADQRSTLVGPEDTETRSQKRARKRAERDAVEQMVRDDASSAGPTPTDTSTPTDTPPPTDTSTPTPAPMPNPPAASLAPPAFSTMAAPVGSAARAPGAMPPPPPAASPPPPPPPVGSV